MDKKELKKQYKQNPPKMGIYQIKNFVTGKIFIGSSKDLHGKFNSIKFQLKRGSHMSTEMQKDFNKYGENNFSLEVVDYLDPKEEPGYDYTTDLKMLESLWIEKLQPFDEKGYNVKKVKK